MSKWVSRRLWALRRRVSRVLDWLSPVRFCRAVVDSGWGYYPLGYQDSWKTDVAHWLLWKWEIVRAIFFCICGSRGADWSMMPGWQMALYRVKAVCCLLLGRHSSEEHCRFDGVGVAEYDGEVVGYYEPEYECSTVEVGHGFRNWQVCCTFRRLI